ncbi:MAG: hormogonium polysaccharide biosynthesis protein HpsA [Nostoc sp. TH1S01]|nr:hormogonium polysaccharide biosynthesis protein HpsA [Nostoc sp. TH1S01]
MSLQRQLVKILKIISKKISNYSLFAFKKRINWLLRTLFLSRRRRDSVNAGFVLPTVAMVALVVVLLSAAILFRSFERAKNASNVRVNEVVLNAATPAIDRARAKIDALLEDPTLPRGTPTDSALYDALTKTKYSLGDETRLKLTFDGINSTAGIQTSTTIENDETLKTAWKYAVDTDNNGKKDTFTLYGIYFRTPTRNATTGQFNRKRNPLEARTPPMDNASTNTQCTSAVGFSTLVGNSSWYQLQSGNLGKSFFVYTVNVPITQAAYNAITTNQSQYEPYKGNKSIAAIEFQQDRSRVPLPNNAVWFENDLEIIVGATDLLLNGRIHTNGNLLVGRGNGSLVLRQVSSKTSCFYNQENGLISVGGNVGTGNVNQNTNQNAVTVDLYQGFGQGIATAQISSTEKSTSSTGGSQIGFNDTAYNERIARMKADGLAACTTCQSATTANALISAVNASGYPEDVKRNVAAKVKSSDDAATAKNVLADEIEIYLRNRTRRVPFAEVASGSSGTTGYTAINVSLTPQATWREPINSSNQLTGTTITLNETKLSATYPTFQKQKGTQLYLGDRVLVGNNLPAIWLLNGQYVGSDGKDFVKDSSANNVEWTEPPSPNPAQNQNRWRNSQIQAIADLGISDRNGFWEEKAAENPINDLDSVGGARIVTGAGIYVDGTGNTVNTTTGPFYPRGLRSFLSAPSTTDATIVWPDTMPMSTPADASKKGDLLMRATAVYHYKVDYGTDQEPIACVSSYYDSTDSTTEKNKVNKDGGYGIDTTNGRSNNGVVYDYPGRGTFTTNKKLLQLQANLKFPNGRWANKPLQDALAKIGTGTTVPSTGLQLADYSAIDTALCAISILNNEAGFATSLTNKPPHGAIKEATFLDAREAKQISAATNSTTYDLDLEQRQPLEIRVTDIDLNQLRGTVIATSEYLLPYSGIIYVSREDALRDASDTTAESELLSPTDFKLDPTRRPNGIRLINGETLARKTSTDNNAYNPKEKGLILVTNLPAYIKGKFNVHQPSLGSTTELEEFTEKEPTTNFYTRSTAETRFACRPGRTGCPTGTGDYWRPATLISDSMTLLSGGFVDGFRSDGDYNLNNNSGVAVDATDPARTNRLKNGFWENYFATNASWWQTSGTNKNFPTTNAGSYARNGITPIQRRIDNYPMYVMELCRKDLIEQCTPSDWVVGFNMNGDTDLDDPVQLDLNSDGDTSDPGESLVEKDIKAYQLGKAIITAYGSNVAGGDYILTNNELGWSTTFTTGSFNKSIRDRLGAGDTGTKSALVPADRRYPRRVAFARNDSNQLITSGTSATYKPMGIGCPLDTTGNTFANNGCSYATSGLTEGTHYGQRGDSALWFRTIVNTANDPTAIANVRYNNDQSLFYYPPIDGSDADTNPDLDGQPRLVPVLQIHNAEDTTTTNNASIRNDGTTVASGDDFRSHWLQIPNADTTFNATFVLGNSPSRPEESSAGLQNLVRFLEDWRTFTAKISGSFIQLKRSAYATAPIAPIFTDRTTTTSSVTNNLSLFDYALDNYPTQNGNGVLPTYSPPDRKWGFDVGLLSEQPDLFAQRFTLPSTGRPNEFFREVGRDDPWVKALLCAVEPSSGSPTAYVTPDGYRPSDCSSLTSIPNN